MPPASMAVGLLLGGVLALVRLAPVRRAGRRAGHRPNTGDVVSTGGRRAARAAAGRGARGGGRRRPPAATTPSSCWAAASRRLFRPALPEPDLSDACRSRLACRPPFSSRRRAAHHRERRLVSVGRRGGPATTEAEAMRQFLLDLGVPAEAHRRRGQVAEHDREHPQRARHGRRRPRRAGHLGLSHAAGAADLARRAGLNVGAFPDRLAVLPPAAPSWENWCRRSARCRSGRAIRHALSTSP